MPRLALPCSMATAGPGQTWTLHKYCVTTDAHALSVPVNLRFDAYRQRGRRVALIKLLMLAWRSAYSALRRMPLLCLTTLIALVVESLVRRAVAEYAGTPYGHASSRSADLAQSHVDFIHAVIGIPYGVAWAFTIAPLAVSTHRMVSLGELSDRTVLAFGRRDIHLTLSVTALYFIISLFETVDSVIDSKAHPALFLGFFLSEIVVCIILTRLALVFPALALEIEHPARLSITSTKRHTIKILTAIVLVSMTAFLPTLLIYMPLRAIAQLFGSHGFHEIQPYLVQVVGALMAVFVTLALAATGSHFLKAYSVQERHPLGP